MATDLERKRLNDEFKKLKAKADELGLNERMPFSVLSQYIFLTVLTVVFAVIAMQTSNLAVFIVSCIISSYGAVGLSTCAHSCSHVSVTGIRKVDKALATVGFTYILGFSISFWQHKHVDTHHANPNNIDYDGDIQQGPLFVVTDYERNKATGFYRAFHKIQGWIIPFALAFNIIGSNIKGYRFLLEKIMSGKASRTNWLDLILLLPMS